MTVGQSTERFIIVLGQECRLTVAHVSKSVWLAGGDFAGRRRTAKAASAGGAVLAWKRDVEGEHKPPVALKPPPVRKRITTQQTAYPLAPKAPAAKPDRPNGPNTRTLRYLARRRRAW